MFDEQYLRKKIKRLSECVWEGRAKRVEIDAWLSSFSERGSSGVNERLHMLHLLSNFLYFGIGEIRELLRAHFQYACQRPVVTKIRQDNADTIDIDFIDHQLRIAISRTRFLAVGNPSESGQHLLYYFRQENNLPAGLFPNQFELPGFPGASDTHGKSSVDRYFFIDDICGSGQQIEKFSRNVIQTLSKAHPDAKITYCPIFATSDGLDYTRKNTAFSDIRCLMELDASFKCFSPTSRFYEDPALRSEAEKICFHYGRILHARDPLGYKDGQLAIGFNHNTPDNTLPIFWAEHPTSLPGWSPIFRRYMKWA
ncbi:phosphoribosyltransferase-like protein [Bradyrhizobium cajani]|uniref:PRTase-CE domain-containing protein n=1 Tax=Bradyrhizobium cajani TaxID=1928661 RepID=A0A844TB86_9BRAD|nr:hypothetical protein [Bradyrhizobium cajani]MCP3371611.1 hypothetical protein [Bradyrhizobium cajani]MVT72341.1 hypothetical protein [Bradyrhizobium cajani]